MALVAQNFLNISAGLGSRFAEIPPDTITDFFFVSSGAMGLPAE